MEDEWDFVPPAVDTGPESKSLVQALRCHIPLLQPKRLPKMMYFPLANRNNTIRVLELLPGSGAEPIHCNLQPTVVDGFHDYTALSYTWGNPYALTAGLPTKSGLSQCRRNWTTNQSADKTLHVDGIEVVVGANLHAALTALRRTDRTRMLWVDAICINQDDQEERSDQVAMMHKIYRNAWEVLIWLGPDDNLLSKHWSHLPIPVHQTGAFSALSSSWFQRLWVIQEAVKAARVSILIGSTELDWQQIGMVGIPQSHWSVSDAEIGIWLEAQKAIRGLRELRYASKREPLEKLFVYAQGKHCTDPRDRIFAVLSLAAPGLNGKGIVRPNYRLSILEAQRELVQASIEGYRRLDVLQYVIHTDPGRHRPSWMPTWDKATRSVLRFSETSSMNSDARIIGPGSNEPDPQLTTPGLRVSGAIILEVSALGSCQILERQVIPEGQSVFVLPDDVEDEQPQFWVRLQVLSNDPTDDEQSGGEQSSMIRPSIECLGVDSGCNLRKRLHLTRQASRSYERIWSEWCKQAYKRKFLRTADQKIWHTPARDAEDLLEPKYVERPLGDYLAEQAMDIWSLASSPHYKTTMTSQDVLAIVPKLTKPGDLIVLLKGSRIPFVIRPVPDLGPAAAFELGLDPQTAFELIGACYIEQKVRWKTFEQASDLSQMLLV